MENGTVEVLSENKAQIFATIECGDYEHFLNGEKVEFGFFADSLQELVENLNKEDYTLDNPLIIVSAFAV